MLDKRTSWLSSISKSFQGATIKELKKKEEGLYQNSLLEGHSIIINQFNENDSIIY